MSFSAISAGLGFVGQTSGLIPPLRRLLEYSYNNAFPNEILDPSAAAQLYIRENIDERDFYQYAADHGLNEQEAERLYKLFRQYLTPQEYIELVRRGKFDAEKATDRLRQMGYTPEDVENLVEVTKYFPSPGDLVRFAVREVYSPDVAQRFGLFEDLPQQFIDNAFKAGLDEEHAKQYWAAHWDLPSPNMGFEMFHRRIIEKDDLQLLLKSLDIMPYWRDKLIDLSYNPLTRVDVRRMHDLGVLDDEGVYNAYLDIGYSPENAERMLQFTKLYNEDDLDGISRSSALDAYNKDIISKEQLTEYLTALQYSEDVVDFWVSVAEYNKTMEVVDNYKNSLINAYRRGAVSIPEVQQKLSEYGLSSDYVQKVTEELVLDQANKMRVPSKSELYSWLDTGVINEEQFADYMKQLGFPEETVGLYLTQYRLTGKSGTRKYLPWKVYQEWYVKDVVSRSYAAEQLHNAGYSDDDIDNILSGGSVE